MGQSGPQTYRIINICFRSSGLDCVILTEGSIMGDMGVYSVIIIRQHRIIEPERGGEEVNRSSATRILGVTELCN